MNEQIVKTTRVMALVKDMFKHANSKELVIRTVVQIYDTNTHDATLFVEKLMETKHEK